MIFYLNDDFIFPKNEFQKTSNPKKQDSSPVKGWDRKQVKYS